MAALQAELRRSTRNELVSLFQETIKRRVAGETRTANERLDFLMQDAPDDMFSAALALLGDRAIDVAGTIATLHAPLHPNCYLSPVEFGAKFRAATTLQGQPQSYR